MSRVFFVLAIVLLAVFSASPTLLIRLISHTDELVSDVRKAFISERSSDSYSYQELRIAGDVMLGRHVETLMKENGDSYPYSRLNTATNSTWLGNFEATVPDQHRQTEDFTFAFSVDKKFVDAAYQFGFNHFSLANNHSFDFGPTVFEETKKNLSTFETFGRPGEVDKESVEYVNLVDHVVGVLAIDATGGYPNFTDVNVLVKEMTKSSDSQLVYIHWGEEYVLKHNDKQEEFAKGLVGMGIDAIIGHHPHVIQDVAKIDDAVVFYSLGNFVFDQYFDQNVQEGLVLALTVEDNQLVFELLPVTSLDARAAPRYLTASEREQFLAELAKRSDLNLVEALKKGSIYIDF